MDISSGTVSDRRGSDGGGTGPGPWASQKPQKAGRSGLGAGHRRVGVATENWAWPPRTGRGLRPKLPLIACQTLHVTPRDWVRSAPVRRSRQKSTKTERKTNRPGPSGSTNPLHSRQAGAARAKEMSGLRAMPGQQTTGLCASVRLSENGVSFEHPIGIPFN